MSITEQYGKKGPDVVTKNHKAVDVSLENVVEVKYPDSWRTATTGGMKPGSGAERPDFVSSIMDPVLKLEGELCLFLPFPSSQALYFSLCSSNLKVTFSHHSGVCSHPFPSFPPPLESSFIFAFVFLKLKGNVHCIPHWG